MFRRFFRELRSRPARGIFLVAVVAQVVVLMRFAASNHFLPGSDDMKFYNDWAQRIAAGQWTDHRAFYGLPGYAYLLAIAYLVVGKLGVSATVAVVGILQAILSAGVATLLYRLSCLTFASELGEDSPLACARPHVTGGLAALAWVCFTPAQAFSAILMPTVWLVLAYYLCVWFAVKTRVSSWWQPWIFLGIGCGLVATMVATILFALPLLIVAIFLTVNAKTSRQVRLRSSAFAVVALIGGVYVGASPAWIHNYFIAREPVLLSAHSGINFWIGNNPTATGYPKMPPGIRATQEGLLRDSITLAEEAAGRPLTRTEVSHFWSARADDYIRRNPVAWLRLMGVKFGNFWNAFQYDDVSIIKLLRDEGVLPPGLAFGFIAALGLAGMLPAIILFPRARWIAAAVVLHMAAVLTVFVTERYRLAAVPGLMLLGTAGLWQMWTWLVTARWLPASGYTAAAAGAALFVSSPRGELRLWSLDHYKAGIRATDAGDFDRAQRNLETAYAYVQTNADIDFALGNLWFERSNVAADAREKLTLRTRAKLYYRLALELNPQHAGTLNNLGVLALEEQRYDLAERFFLGALASDPDAAKTYFRLARARYEAGHLPEARAALEEALRRRPQRREFLLFRDQLTPLPATPQAPAPPAAPAR